MPDTTAADAIARIEAHRTHPHTCAACGVTFNAKASEVEPIERTLLNRNTGTYGLCPTCKADPSEAAAIAGLFDLDSDDAALDGLTVAWFADLAHAMPSRPNSTPWAHLDPATLAAAIEARRADIDKRRGGPCSHCATTLTNEGGRWWRGPGDRFYCESCWSVLDLLSHGPARRDGALLTVAALCGGVLANRVGDLPRDLPQHVGYRAPKLGEVGDRPFAYLDILAMRRRAKAYLTRVGWRWADEYHPEQAGVVRW